MDASGWVQCQESERLSLSGLFCSFPKDFMSILPAAEGTAVGGQIVESDQGCGNPLVCAVTGSSGVVSIRYWGGWVSWLPGPGAGTGCVPKAAWAPGWLRVSMLVAGAGPQVTVHMHGAGCWQGVSVFIFPKPAVHDAQEECACVCVCQPSSNWIKWWVGWPWDQAC